MLNLLFLSNKCAHNKVYPLSEGAFCPDCGQEIMISWQILRCECCSTKRKAHTFENELSPVRLLTVAVSGFTPASHMGKLVPEEKFCKKCGSSDYYIETKEKIEFFDYEYAVILKEEINAKSKIKKTLQVWIEEENIREIFAKPKLLPLFQV